MLHTEVFCVAETLADLQPLPTCFWGLVQNPARAGPVVILLFESWEILVVWT